MMSHTFMARRILLLAVTLSALAAQPAHASFHLMQIEQVIGGVNGDVAAQAVQLRMRVTGENFVSQGRLLVRDAAGLNPVTVVDTTTNVTNGTAGSRVLIASSAFLTYVPGVTPDFMMTHVIPPSYLAAGTLTWESDTGIVYWRLSWGGASYTGTGAGNLINDPDGNFSPPFAGPLPSVDTHVLLFQFATSAASTNNANDYALSAGSVAFVNNAGASGNIDADADGLANVTDNCTLVVNADQYDADADGYGNICDADLNNSGTVTVADYTILRNALNSNNANADLNHSGTVTVADYTILRNRLNTHPGPSGLHPNCPPTCP